MAENIDTIRSNGPIPCLKKQKDDCQQAHDAQGCSIDHRAVHAEYVKLRLKNPHQDDHDDTDEIDSQVGCSLVEKIKNEIPSDNEIDHYSHSESGSNPDNSDSEQIEHEPRSSCDVKEEMDSEIEKEQEDNINPAKNDPESKSSTKDRKKVSANHDGLCRSDKIVFVRASTEPQDAGEDVLIDTTTLPDELCVKDSDENGETVRGVWSTKLLDQGVVFGPFSSPTHTSDDVQRNTAPIKSSTMDKVNVEIWRTQKLIYIRVCQDVPEGTQLVQHKRGMNQERAVFNICSVCGQKFCNSGRMENHPHGRKDKSNKFTQCDKCAKGFSNAKRLSAHKGRKSQKQRHDHLLNPSKVHRCFRCGKWFRMPCSVRRHLTVCGQRQCPYCDKPFRLSSHLNDHILIHTLEKPHVCAKCGKSFGRRGDLNRHMIIHDDVKPHCCIICGTSYAQRTSLKHHMYSHTMEKGFECPLCGKDFKRRSDLQRHEITHSDVKAHLCSICGKCFKLASHLKEHMSSHTGEKRHQCPYCCKFFAKNLKQHILTHTQERPHHCSVCAKSFTQSCHLKNHMMTHTQEKPHKCVVCGKSFARGLQQHMLTHKSK